LQIYQVVDTVHAAGEAFGRSTALIKAKAYKWMWDSILAMRIKRDLADDNKVRSALMRKIRRQHQPITAFKVVPPHCL